MLSAAAGESTASAEDPPPLPGIIPWEEFDNDKNQHVLVLWLDEDVLTAGRHPIGSLVELASKPGLPPGSEFALLGPEDSTMLKAMVHEPPSSSSVGFSIYNFGATAEEKKIVEGGRIGDALKNLGVEHYYRLVNTDDELAKVLVCELMRRDPNLGLSSDKNQCSKLPSATGPRDHIVLISDWDTVYGSDLRKTVAETFSGTTKEQKIDADWIRRVSYLRGLDGRLPDRKDTKQAASPQNGGGAQQAPVDQTTGNQPTAATPETTSRFESAEGQSQFDYLRRLAADLKERDARYWRTDGSHIGAIGVLGSDVNDKLLILQALRPELPEALFFTTDLDELLLPQKKTRYTRNLLVASSFGLTLGDELQSDIPPFRNTYQTSIFRATQAAIADRFAFSHPSICEYYACKDGKFEGWSPGLFQIGRTEAFALPIAPGGDPIEATRAAVPSAIQGFVFGPPKRDSLICASVIVAAVLIFLQMCASYLIRQLCDLIRRNRENRALPNYNEQGLGIQETTGNQSAQVQPIEHFSDWLMRAAAKPGLLAIAAICLCRAWPTIAGTLTQNGLGEPMSLLEGISLWPVVMVRVIGSGLCLWLIGYTLVSLENNLYETEAEMSIPHRRAAALGETWRGIRTDYRSYPLTSQVAELLWLGTRPIGQNGTPFRRPPLCFLRFTSRYANRTWARCFRALTATVVMFVFGWILSLLSGEPNIPARGSVAGNFFFTITIVEVFVTLFLVFLVADATLLSREFVNRLTAVSTVWPATTLLDFRTRFGLDDAHLADWLDIQFLGRRTHSITRVIYFPFIALAFLVFSRSKLFDDFVTSWAIVVIQAFSVAIVIGSAIALRLAAEKARAVACEHMNAQIIAAKDEDAPRLEKLLDEVKNLNDGAFAPWASQPVVRAVLLPLITFGGTWLLHLYALPGI